MSKPSGVIRTTNSSTLASYVKDKLRIRIQVKRRGIGRLTVANLGNDAIGTSVAQHSHGEWLPNTKVCYHTGYYNYNLRSNLEWPACTDSSARHPYEHHPGVDPWVLRLCNPGTHPSRLRTRGNIRAATRVIHFTPQFWDTLLLRRCLLRKPH
ncbi:hypothetical protein BDV93DRAFT_577477 [Ceratobasidium sp. AG-I]|nr:hypothetical protein BDV93DRAFT_577477 [Ceratobasidium sp. AG-I]